MKRIYLVLGILCLMTNLQAQIDGDNIFSTNQVIRIDLNFSQPGFLDSLADNYTTADYMSADLILTDNTGTYNISNVGVRYKGNSSYNHPNGKKSFKIDFNEYVSGQNYDGLKKLNFSNGFKDPSLMREKVFFDVCRAAGVPAPRASFANVYFNNTLIGFYTVVEQIDDQFLDWKILDDDGNLFKAGDNFGAGPAGGTTPADLVYYGANQTDYTDRYELKTNETADDWSDLITLIDFINNSTDADFENGLASRIELTEYLRSVALDNLFSNLDSYTGSARNYYIYHNLTTDKWQWIKWDGNESFGSYANGVNTITNLPVNYNNASRPLLSNLFNSPVLYQQYLAEVCDITTDYFNSAYLDPLIDNLKTLIQASVYADNNKMYTNADFDTNITSNITSGGGPGGGSTTYGLKSFIQAKATYISGAVDCATIVNTNEIKPYNIGIFPNPATLSTTITWDDEPVERLEIVNVVGTSIYQEQTKGKAQTIVNVADFESGIYFVLMHTPERTLNTKLMIIK